VALKRLIVPFVVGVLFLGSVFTAIRVAHENRLGPTHPSRLGEAVRDGNLPIVVQLLEEGADVNERVGNNSGISVPGNPQKNCSPTVLHLAAANFLGNALQWRVVKALIDHGADVNALDCAKGMTPLEYAFRYDANYFSGPDRFHIARELSAHPLRPETIAKRGEHLLEAAVWTNDAEIVSNILAMGPTQDQRESVLSESSPAVLELLVAGGVSKQSLDEALVDAIGFGKPVPGASVEIVNALLSHGASANTSANGISALHVAAYKGNVDVTRILLAGGARVSATDSDGLTPLDYARNSAKRSPDPQFQARYRAVVEALEAATARQHEDEGAISLETHTSDISH
jgi:ankyrin repeat protein